jgi:predicted anti-sigma-YlaC factor YlaD
MTVHEATCERARRLASLRPDGPGSELEELFLAFHLADCAGCRAYADAVAASTAAIRATPPIEAPAFALLAGRRRRIPMRALQAAAAAVIVATAGLSGLAGLSQQQQVTAAPSAQRPAYLDSASYEQALIQKLQRAAVRFHQGSRIAS